MRAVVQRVSKAAVHVDGAQVGAIGHGLLIFLGVAKEDTESDLLYLVDKIVGLRIFEDEAGKMNRSVQDVAGAALVVSQFTLMADCRKGRRPGFSAAAAPEQAEGVYETFVRMLQQKGVEVATGHFQAEMEVSLVNQGPVTMLLDSRRSF